MEVTKKSRKPFRSGKKVETVLEGNPMKVYIVFFYCCQFSPQAIYGVYSTQKKAEAAAKKVLKSWIEVLNVDEGKRVYGT